MLSLSIIRRALASLFLAITVLAGLGSAHAGDNPNPNEAIIYDNGKQITFTTEQDDAGEKIVLNCGNVLNKPMSSFVWTITGTGVIANYTVSKQTGTITPFDPANLTKQTFPIYDVKDETIDLKVTITMTDTTTVVGNAKIKFNKPANTFTGTIDTVQIVPAGTAGQWELSLGNFAAKKPGAVFNGTYTAPPSGSTAIFQFIADTFVQIKGGDSDALTVGSNLSDTKIPAASGGTTVTSNDTPAEPLSPATVKKATVATKFKNWLMFKPDKPEAIYVPLKSINWEWAGTATLNAAGTGYDLGGPSQKMAGAVDETGMPPTWTKTAPEDLTTTITIP